jgi:hypothetical protein
MTTDNQRKYDRGWQDESRSILGGSPSSRHWENKILDPTNRMAYRLERFPYSGHDGYSERLPTSQQEGPGHPQMGEKGGWELPHQGSLPRSHGSGIEPDIPIWSKVWNPQLWPKVATFLWLAANKKSLTWDRIIKRGFEGPVNLSAMQSSGRNPQPPPQLMPVGFIIMG